jgi:hypothetical protein
MGALSVVAAEPTISSDVGQAGVGTCLGATSLGLRQAIARSPPQKYNGWPLVSAPFHQHGIGVLGLWLSRWILPLHPLPRLAIDDVGRLSPLNGADADAGIGAWTFQQLA